MGVNKPVGIKSVNRLVDILLSRSFQKKSDIKLLIENGYEKEKAEAYMDGYVDAISNALSFIYPEIDFDEYINTVIENRLINPYDLKVGDIILSHNAKFLYNISIVYGISEAINNIDSEGNKKESKKCILLINTFPILFSVNNTENILKINIGDIMHTYPDTGYIDLSASSTLCINLPKTKITNGYELSIVGHVERKIIKEIIDKHNDYVNKIENMYNEAIKKANEYEESLIDKDYLNSDYNDEEE